MIKLSRYQWTVFFAAWLGWGFDIFDGLLFNFVAPNAIPTLLGLPIGGPEAKQALPYWTGILNSLLLLGWAAGGVIFGPICDRFGRKRVLMSRWFSTRSVRVLRLRHRMWRLVIFRIVAGLIGGEWAAPPPVAEVVPESGSKLAHCCTPGAVRSVPHQPRECRSRGSLVCPRSRRCPGAMCCYSACCLRGRFRRAHIHPRARRWTAPPRQAAPAAGNLRAGHARARSARSSSPSR
jgi:hypothetical protein